MGIYINKKHYQFLLHTLIPIILYNQVWKEMDHVNRIKTDNRKCNLRPASKSSNQRNKSLRTDNLSGFKGVSWYKPTNKWVVKMRLDGKTYCLGYYFDLQYAARIYNTATFLVDPEFSYMNDVNPKFIEEKDWPPALVKFKYRITTVNKC